MWPKLRRIPHFDRRRLGGLLGTLISQARQERADADKYADQPDGGNQEIKRPRPSVAGNVVIVIVVVVRGIAHLVLLRADRHTWS